MPRHSKNNTNGAALTRWEIQEMGYGTQKARLGKDSLLDFDCCSLCLQWFRDPMACPQGHIYCRECVIKSLLDQKKAIKRETAAWIAQQKEEEQARLAEAAAQQAAQVAAFEAKETDLTSIAGDGKAAAAPAASGTGDVASENYWLPRKTPDAGPARVQAPRRSTQCVPGQHALKMKELTALQFTPLAGAGSDGDDTADVLRQRYACPVCLRELSNGPRLTAAAPCGHVTCASCRAKFTDASSSCQICSASVDNVINLVGGGTGYAGHGDQLEAEKHGPAARV